MDFIEERHTYHNAVRYWFYRYISNDISDENLDQLRQILYSDNNKQWAEVGTNIIKHTTNCPQLCRYCYNIAWKHRSEKIPIPDIEDIREDFVPDEKKVLANWTKRRKPRLYIFGSTHDIFPEMVDQYIDVARRIIESGSEILIVTKARLTCIQAICHALDDLKDKVMIICTITSNDPEILKYWEPHAPSYEERKQCLRHAYECGYRTSVSMEPYLSDPRPMVEELTPYVTHCIWIGKMNHCKELEFDEEQYSRTENLYDEDYVRQMILDLWDNEKVFYKYSMFRIMGLTGKRS